MIAELVIARHEDKIHYENTLKEKENLSKIFDRRRRRILETALRNQCALALTWTKREGLNLFLKKTELFESNNVFVVFIWKLYAGNSYYERTD